MSKDVLKEVITVNMTVRDAIKELFVLSRTNGLEDGMYIQLKNKLMEFGDTQVVVDKACKVLSGIDYWEHQYAVEELFLSANKKYKLIDDLESKVRELLEQIKEIKSSGLDGDI